MTLSSRRSLLHRYNPPLLCLYFSAAANNLQTASKQPASSDFESFYLQQVTTEFADDLDKIRNANDFGEKSLPMLVAALKQGVGMYSEEERRKVMGTL